MTQLAVIGAELVALTCLAWACMALWKIAMTRLSRFDFVMGAFAAVAVALVIATGSVMVDGLVGLLGWLIGALAAALLVAASMLARNRFLRMLSGLVTTKRQESPEVWSRLERRWWFRKLLLAQQ